MWVLAAVMGSDCKGRRRLVPVDVAAQGARGCDRNPGPLSLANSRLLTALPAISCMTVAENLEFKPRAIRDLDKLPRNLAQRILGKIESLQQGGSSDVKRLTNFTPEYRLRVGDYRVLFERDAASIIIYRVVHRSQAYD